MAATQDESYYELANQYLDPDFPYQYGEIIMKYFLDSETFMLKALHEIFQSEKYKGAKMVEVGCGPTIYKLASASKYYDEIITSDFAPKNRECVERWLVGDPEALDWTPLLQIVAEQEGYSDVSLGVKNIEARIRQKVKSVVHCDVLKESVLPAEIKDVDLMLTSYCLEGACPNLESYASAIQKLGNYVRPGGCMIVFVVIGMSYAKLAGKDIKVLNVDENTLTRSLKDAGFRLDHRYYRENVDDIDVTEFRGHLLLTAIKE